MVTREQIESIYMRFGHPVAISMHKGYAFVQYATEHEARSAVSFTDGMQLGGQAVGGFFGAVGGIERTTVVWEVMGQA